jgi:hypothetical protein
MADFLSDLLNTSLESSPGGETPGWLGSDPNRMAVDRASSVEAIKHYLVTGQPPPEVQAPSYGPVDALLKGIGARSKFRPVNPGLSEDMSLAGDIRKSEGQGALLDKLKAVQEQGMQFGTNSARTTAETLGAPELEASFPKDVKGIGELRVSQQDLTLQKLLMSQDVKEQQLGLQQQAMQVREAIANGNMDRAQQLIQMGQQRIGLEQDRLDAGPVNQTAQALLTSTDTREGQLIEQLSRALSDPLAGENSPAVTRIEAELAKVRKQRSQLLKARGVPKEFQSIYDEGTDDTPAPKKGGVKPAPAGLFD